MQLSSGRRLRHGVRECSATGPDACQIAGRGVDVGGIDQYGIVVTGAFGCASNEMSSRSRSITVWRRRAPMFSVDSFT